MAGPSDAHGAQAASDARGVMLARIRAALGPDPASVTVPRDYAVRTDLTHAEVLDRFVERVEDYRATVTRAPDATAVAEVIATLLAPLTPGDPAQADPDDAAGPVTVVVPHDLDRSWLPDGLDVLADAATDPLPVADLDTAHAVVTAAAVGIAETGTVVLDGGTGQGRRAATLVPDVHVLVVPAEQVVATVPEGVRRLDPTRPQTWISGPSATSDIELDRVEGVHGPRTLHVILIG